MAQPAQAPMTDFVPILACRGPVFTPGETAVIICVLLGWLASLVLALVNPCLVLFLNVSKRAKAAHLLFWAVYLGAGVAVWLRALAGMQGQAWLIPIFGVPPLAIFHLVMLFWLRRQSRLKRQTAHDA